MHSYSLKETAAEFYGILLVFSLEVFPDVRRVYIFLHCMEHHLLFSEYEWSGITITDVV